MLEADYAHVPGGPSLRSPGKDCKYAGGKTMIWVEGRIPCYVDRKNNAITIFEVESDNPMYYPGMEESEKQEGTFDKRQNVFRVLTGVFVNSDGNLCLEPFARF